MLRKLALSVLMFAPLVATAQNTRSAVSITGSDAATCAVTDPCRSIAAALLKTTAGGEVIALTSGGYGSFTVTQSVTVASPSGIYAAVSATSGAGVLISTPSGNSVVLRGLSVSSAGGPYGVYLASPATVYLEDMVITGFNGSGSPGLYVPGAQADLRIENSLFRNNFYGMNVAGSSSTARLRATVDHCRFEGNTIGVAPDNSSTVTINGSVVTGGFRGISIDSNGADIDAHVTVSDSVFSQNQVGIFAIRTAALVYVSGSTITQNSQIALDIQQGAQVLSAGDNVVIDNAGNENFSGSFALK